jgi:hypothetical protein
LIPVLQASSEYELASGTAYQRLALRLVDKRTGDAGEPVSIRGDFGEREGTCRAYLLATPTRIIAQANGNLVAYGRGAK